MILFGNINNMAKSLTELASNIINSKVQTIKDIKELAKIKFNMSKQYQVACWLAWKMEDEYNKTRSKATKDAIDIWLSVGNAEIQWKFVAECNWLDKGWREAHETLRGMSMTISSIRDFIISWYTENKSLGEYLDTNPIEW